MEPTEAWVRRDNDFTSHDKKHIKKAMTSLSTLARICEKNLVKLKTHNYYPNDPDEQALANEALKKLVKERKAIVRTAGRLLELIA